MHFRCLVYLFLKNISCKISSYASNAVFSKFFSFCEISVYPIVLPQFQQKVWELLLLVKYKMLSLEIRHLFYCLTLYYTVFFALQIFLSADKVLFFCKFTRWKRWRHKYFLVGLYFWMIFRISKNCLNFHLNHLAFYEDNLKFFEIIQIK